MLGYIPPSGVRPLIPDSGRPGCRSQGPKHAQPPTVLTVFTAWDTVWCEQERYRITGGGARKPTQDRCVVGWLNNDHGRGARGRGSSQTPPPHLGCALPSFPDRLAKQGFTDCDWACCKEREIWQRPIV